MPKFGYFQKPHRLNNPASFIQKWAWETPHRKAIVMANEEQVATLSFRELNHISNNLCVKLKTLGFDKGKKVFVSSRMSLRLIVIYISLIRIGAKVFFSDDNESDESFDFYIYGDNREVDSFTSFILDKKHSDSLFNEVVDQPENPIEEVAWTEELVYFQKKKGNYFYKTARQVCAGVNVLRNSDLASDGLFYCPYFHMTMDLVLSGKTVVTGVKDLATLQKYDIEPNYFFLPQVNFEQISSLSNLENTTVYVATAQKPVFKEFVEKMQKKPRIIFIYGLAEKEIMATQELQKEEDWDVHHLGSIDPSVTCKQEGSSIAIASESLPLGYTSHDSLARFEVDEFGVNWFYPGLSLKLKNKSLYLS